MSEYKIGFSWIAVLVFALPMLINIVYCILPPANVKVSAESGNKILEMIEQATRVLYLLALVLINKKGIILRVTSIWFILAVVCLGLYYIVWIRYFVGGRDIQLLGESFLGVPMPLAVFPVLYFIFAAIWMNNYVAVGFMVIFGIVHNIISYQSFH